MDSPANKKKFLEACKSCDLKTVVDFISNGFDVNAEYDTTINGCVYKGITPLGIVVNCNHIEIVKFLLQLYQIDINKSYKVKTKYGKIDQFTFCDPLTNCVASKRNEIFNLLMKDNRIKVSEYSFFQACSMPDAKEYIELFINSGFSVNLCSDDWHFGTPLITAIFCKTFENVQLLFEKGADINYIFRGQTPLDYAFDNMAVQNDAQALKIIQFLLENGAKSGMYSQKKKNINKKLEEALPEKFDNNMINIIADYTV